MICSKCGGSEAIKNIGATLAMEVGIRYCCKLSTLDLIQLYVGQVHEKANIGKIILYLHIFIAWVQIGEVYLHCSQNHSYTNISCIFIYIPIHVLLEFLQNRLVSIKP